MGCCCSRPVDDEEEGVKTDPNGGYGTIKTLPEDSIHETPFKDPQEKTKDDPVISKRDSAPSTPTKKEHTKLTRTATPTNEKSPLIETPPSRFGKKSSKASPRTSPFSSPFSSPKSSPKASPKHSPKPSPKRSPKPSPKKELKNGSAGKQKVAKKKSSPKSERPSNKDYNKLQNVASAPAHRKVSPVSDSPSPPSSPKMTLLELATSSSHSSMLDSGSREDLRDQSTITVTAADSDSSFDDEELKASFDNNPVCQSSGDELSPRVVETEPPAKSQSLGLQGYSKTDKQNLSSSSLSKGTSKAKDAMKKTSKGVKKMFKFGGGKKKETGEKTKKADKKKDKAKEDAASKKSNVTFSPSTKREISETQSSPAATDTLGTGIKQPTKTSPSRKIPGKRGRMSERMHSTYARERLEAHEAKKDALRKTQSAGFVDPRKAANERGQKLGELEDATDKMRDSSAGFAEMARQLRMQSERGGKS